MARDNKSGLTAAFAKELINKGVTQAEVARSFDVSRQYVNLLLQQQEGFTKTPRKRANELFPWPTEKRHTSTYIGYNLMSHAEYQITDGKGMTRKKLKELTGFYRRLEGADLVVEFHPDYPPITGAPHGGFAYVPREPKDSDLIIRVNALADMNDERREIWRLPQEWPRLPD